MTKNEEERREVNYSGDGICILKGKEYKEGLQLHTKHSFRLEAEDANPRATHTEIIQNYNFRIHTQLTATEFQPFFGWLFGNYFSNI